MSREFEGNAPNLEGEVMKQIVLSIVAVTALLLLPGCITTPTQQGAAVGGALGAGAGAIIGNQSGNPITGALIGGAAGGLAGALIGDQVGKNQQRQTAPASTYSTPAPTYAPQPQPQRGHYETRVVVSPSGERYEERVWIPDR